MLCIRFGTSDDARALSAFAGRIFGATFGPDNSAEDMAAHLVKAFSVAQQALELADRAIINLLAEDDGQLVAFAQLRSATPPECVAGPRPLELWRFYVDKPWHGCGVAQMLMAEVFDVARLRGALTLWLGVWQRNLRAQAFYRKCGFTEVGSHEFVLGSDRQTDVLMARQVGGDTG